jgi:hypothetical protein
MRASSLLDVMMGIVFVGLVTTLVAHPNTARDITAAGNAFSNSLKVAVKG